MKSLPYAVWRMLVAYALMMAGASLMVLIGGIIGTQSAPSEALATLPIALAVVGLALSTLPTGRLLDRYGRRPVFIGYGFLAMAAAIGAAFSLVADSFAGFCAAASAMGWAAAAGHQYRFAALELVPPERAATATSVLLLGGILGAFIGPEMAVRGRELLTTEYAGSFLLLAGGYALGTLIMFFYRDRPHHGEEPRAGGRPLGRILKNPVVVVAVSAASVSYGLMSFVMTATPISMHQHAGHSLEVTKWVIQSHIAAMYLPSLVFAWLLDRLGFRGLFRLGIAVFAVALGVALTGGAALNFWAALVLLGVGWNVLFLGGTNLLPHGYRREERFRVQSFNDFVTFTVQALVSLSSGWFLFVLGWRGLLWSGGALVVGFALILWRTGRQLRPGDTAPLRPAAEVLRVED